MARGNLSTLILGDSAAEEKYSIRLAKIKSKPSGGSAVEPIKKQSQNQNSPSLRRWGSSSSKPGRQNCLCSPTTHAGSFRCRHHRIDSLARAGSIGSNLTLLSSKSSRINGGSPQSKMVRRSSINNIHCMYASQRSTGICSMLYPRVILAVSVSDFLKAQ